MKTTHRSEPTASSLPRPCIVDYTRLQPSGLPSAPAEESRSQLPTNVRISTGQDLPKQGDQDCIGATVQRSQALSKLISGFEALDDTSSTRAFGGSAAAPLVTHD